uniref:Cholesterol 24-hydroxylase n=1 Tax=Hucho hucho TaxID=62062 RepID=A0A4W5RSE2_9TELE
MALFHLIAGWIGYVLMCLLGLMLIVFLCFCLYIKYIHLKYDHIPGPPRDSFIFGHSATIMRETSNGRVIHDKFLEWSETYGPVYRINGMHIVMVFVTCPDTTKVNLLDSVSGYSKYSVVLLFRRFLGSGLITAHNHDAWYKQRRIMDPAFSSLYLRGQMGAFNERAERLMDKLADMADTNTAANMHQMFNLVTLDVITKVAFGVDVDLLKESDSPFPKAIEMCLKGMVHYVRDSTFQLYPKNKKFINEVKESVQLLRSTGRRWINERKMAIQNGEDVPKDILTQILKTAGKEENTENEDEELMLDNFVTLFVAGQETTANQLAFAVMELGRLPEILANVKQEVDDVIGMKQEISFDDLGKMTYLSQVLKETLRLYPTAPGTSRFIPNDITINGIPIPAGFNSYVCGRLDKFFEEPLKFDPERFHPDTAKPYYCYYPFALGPRSCLGQSFAQMEAKVVMAKLLQRFDFSLLPGQSFDILDTGTLRPKSGVVCSIRHRGQTAAA